MDKEFCPLCLGSGCSLCNYTGVVNQLSATELYKQFDSLVESLQSNDSFNFIEMP